MPAISHARTQRHQWRLLHYQRAKIAATMTTTPSCCREISQCCIGSSRSTPRATTILKHPSHLSRNNLRALADPRSAVGTATISVFRTHCSVATLLSANSVSSKRAPSRTATLIRGASRTRSKGMKMKSSASSVVPRVFTLQPSREEALVCVAHPATRLLRAGISIGLHEKVLFCHVRVPIACMSDQDLSASSIFFNRLEL